MDMKTKQRLPWLMMMFIGLFPLMGVAQSYDQLWKEVEMYQKKDLPKSVIATAGKIYAKAKAERNLPQLMKAHLVRASQQVSLTPDSAEVEYAALRQWAEEEKAQVTEMELVSQFRCNGSDGYLAWLDHTLEIRDTANFDMEDIDYDIRILDSPAKMQELIIERNRTSHNRARILAGYCWNWKKEGVNDPSVHDIKIGDFEISWNLKNTTTFAIDEDSIHEAGCIHTSQGLEFDYVGVIIGDDMRYENGMVVTDFTKRARTDQSLKGIKKLYKENPELANKEADEIIKNTYRTLMTRGMKGCYVFCTDQRLAAYLKKCLETRKSEGEK